MVAGRRTIRSGAFSTAGVAFLSFLVIFIITLSRPASARIGKPAGERTEPMTIYDFKMTDIEGQEVSLSSYKGRVLLVVNVASRCGFTPQYEGLERLYAKYQDQGLVILGFPANNFMGQESGTDAEIKEFCSTKFHVSFPMFSKISVKGKDQHPLYKFLTAKATNPEFAGDIGWNFTKFVIGREGAVTARFPSKATPESADVIQAIEKAFEKSGAAGVDR